MWRYPYETKGVDVCPEPLVTVAASVGEGHLFGVGGVCVTVSVFFCSGAWQDIQSKMLVQDIQSRGKGRAYK